MPSLVPERPTLPPLRSLALPMHGVPTNMTLPGIHELYNDQLVRFLFLKCSDCPLTQSTLVTGPFARRRTPCLAAQTSGNRLLPNISARAFSSTPPVYCRPPRIYAIQFSHTPTVTDATHEPFGTTCSPRPD
jgi:hypothetical protein